MLYARPKGEDLGHIQEGMQAVQRAFRCPGLIDGLLETQIGLAEPLCNNFEKILSHEWGKLEGVLEISIVEL